MQGIAFAALVVTTLLVPSASADLVYWLEDGSSACNQKRLSPSAPMDTFLCAPGPSASAAGVPSSAFNFRMDEPLEQDLQTVGAWELYLHHGNYPLVGHPRPTLRVAATAWATDEEGARLDLGAAEEPCGTLAIQGECTLLFEVPPTRIPANWTVRLELQFLDDAGVFVPPIDAGEQWSRLTIPGSFVEAPPAFPAVQADELESPAPSPLALLAVLPLAVALVRRR